MRERFERADGLVVQRCAPDEFGRFDALLDEHHWLGRGLFGARLRHVGIIDGEWVALIGWGSAAFRVGARDRWIGWSHAQMRDRLRYVVNNQRFCVLPDARVPNLASAALAGSLRRLSDDYEDVWGHPVLVAETFTDPARHDGGCYRAANFAMLGETAGWGRSNGQYVFHGNTKQVWVRALRRDAACLLSSLFDHHALLRGAHGGVPLIADLNGLDFDSSVGLIARLADGLSEHRSARGIRHSVPSVVAISTAAALTGASSFDAIAQYAQQLPAGVLAKLDCRFHPVKNVYVTPSADTIRRCLTSLNADQLDRIVGGWLADLGVTTTANQPNRSRARNDRGENKRTTTKNKTSGHDADPDPLVGIAVDGKWLRGSGVDGADQVKLFAGMLHHNGAVIGQTQVGDDDSTCELNAMRPLLARLGNLNGKVITADALHCQRDHAEAIIGHNGHYMFGLKDNQRNVLAAAEAIPDSDFSEEHVTTNRGHTRHVLTKSCPQQHRSHASARRDLPARATDRARHPRPSKQRERRRSHRRLVHHQPPRRPR